MYSATQLQKNCKDPFHDLSINRAPTRSRGQQEQKILQIEESGPIASRSDNSLQFRDKPAGGAIWDLDCSTENNVIEANVSCNNDIKDYEGWTVKATIRFYAGPYPADLPFENTVEAEFSCIRASYTIRLKLPPHPMETIDYCKIVIAVDDVTGPQDRRSYWLDPSIPSTFFTQYLIIRGQKFHVIPNSNYVQRLLDRDPSKGFVVLRSISIEAYMVLVNYAIAMGPHRSIKQVDEPTMDLLVDAVYYFEVKHLEGSILRFLCSTDSSKFDIRKVFTWISRIGCDDLKLAFTDILQKQSNIRYPSFLKNRELGIGFSRFTRQ